VAVVDNGLVEVEVEAMALPSMDGDAGPTVLLYDAFPAPAASFGGNVAGVVLLERPAPARWMRLVAAELAAPTTGFVDVASARGGDAPVRFFTPRQEIGACGHVTVAAATALVEVGVWRAGTSVAVTAAGGRSKLVLHEDHCQGQATGRLRMEMGQRLLELQADVALGIEALSGVLGEVPLATAPPVLRAGTGLRHLLVPVHSVADLGRLPLDAAGIAALSAGVKVDTIGVFTVLPPAPAPEGPVLRVRMRDLCAGIGAVEEWPAGPPRGVGVRPGRPADPDSRTFRGAGRHGRGDGPAQPHVGAGGVRRRSGDTGAPLGRCRAGARRTAHPHARGGCSRGSGMECPIAARSCPPGRCQRMAS